MPNDVNIATVNSVSGCSPVDSTNIELMIVPNAPISSYVSTPDCGFTSSTSFNNEALPAVSMALRPSAEYEDEEMDILLLSIPSAPARTETYALTVP